VAKGIFRLAFFLPYVTPMIATAVVFRSIFNPRPESIANLLLRQVGMEPQQWLFESDSIIEIILKSMGVTAYPPWVGDAFPSLAMLSVIIYNIWVYTGYNTVIYLASLTAIPAELIESAEIDGASKRKIFRHIIFPLLSPTTFFLSIVALIGTFKAFNHIYILRTPASGSTVDTASIVIFDTFYKEGNAGASCAMALILFFVILSITALQNRLFGRKVFYR
jgi:ABC-type sugar transport system permease subunit